jgi:hypothetical protein
MVQGERSLKSVGRMVCTVLTCHPSRSSSATQSRQQVLDGAMWCSAASGNPQRWMVLTVSSYISVIGSCSLRFHKKLIKHNIYRRITVSTIVFFENILLFSVFKREFRSILMQQVPIMCIYKSCLILRAINLLYKV